MSKKRTKQASGGVFIAPQTAGSYVSWQLSVSPSYRFKYKNPMKKDAKPEDKVNRGFLNGTIRLGDCSRQISWDFSDGDGGVEKIDKAIKELQKFRKKLVEFEEIINISRKQAGYKPGGDYL